MNAETTLVIDTSFPKSMVCLVIDDVVAERENFLIGMQRSSQIFAAIQKVIANSNVSFNNLSKIVVGIGPGSHIGTRSGVAVAQAIAFATSAEILGACSISSIIPKDIEGDFSIVVDAKMSGFFLLNVEKKLSKISSMQMCKHSKGDIVNILHEKKQIVAYDEKAVIDIFGEVSKNVIVNDDLDPLALLSSTAFIKKIPHNNSLSLFV